MDDTPGTNFRENTVTVLLQPEERRLILKRPVQHTLYRQSPQTAEK